MRFTRLLGRDAELVVGDNKVRQILLLECANRHTVQLRLGDIVRVEVLPVAGKEYLRAAENERALVNGEIGQECAGQLLC